MLKNERARTVLNQIVTLHYNTCEPVGSALISQTRMIPFSPATIRNIMMRLESDGYLSQPYTSAGRLPTDLGYRTYVDGITLDRDPLNHVDRQHLDERITRSGGGPSVLKSVADFIHERTDLISFHLPMRHCGIRMKHIHFERINEQRLLVLWVSRGGQAYQTVLKVEEEDFGGMLIEKTENFFNNAFHDFSLLEIQRNLTQRMAPGNHPFDLLLNKAALISNALYSQAHHIEDLSFQGISRLLKMPEFQNIDKVRIVFDLIEQQSRIKQIVHHVLESENEWIMFFIGKELADPKLEGLALVLAKMRNQRDFLGCVGVIGPKRLPYLKAMQILASAKDQVYKMAS